ncbi:MAG: glycosyltransferase family 39 protein [Chlamydiota bacterium]
MKKTTTVSLLWAIPALAVLSFAGQRHGLWGSDEPREAEIAREMYASRDWVIPRLNGKPFLEKPPLAHLGAALVFQAAAGPTETWCRLSSAVWGLAGLLTTAWLGTMLLGPGAGLLAAFILATSVEWLYVTRLLLVDVPLAACVISSFAFFWAGYTRSGARKMLGYLGCALAAGGAFMAKGTVGIAIPLSAIAVFLLLRREYGELVRIAYSFAAGLAAAALPWVVMIAVRGGRGALRVFLWDNQVLRFFSPGADHAGPPWFYLAAIFEVLLPWALLLPPALIGLARARNETEKEKRGRQFLIAIGAVPFALLSIASGKRQLYLLPLMPGLAIAIARWAAGEWPGPRARWEYIWIRAGVVLFAVTAGGAWCAALGVAAAGRSAIGPGIAGAAAALGSAAIARRAFSREGAPGWSMVALAAIAWSAALSPFVWDRIEASKGYAPLTAMLDANLRPGDTLYGYMPGEREQGVVGFHRQELLPVIDTPEALDTALRVSGRTVVLMREKVYEELREQGALPSSAAVAARCALPHRNQILLRGTHAGE